jgi:hypothetical protein
MASLSTPLRASGFVLVGQCLPILARQRRADLVGVHGRALQTCPQLDQNRSHRASWSRARHRGEALVGGRELLRRLRLATA